MPLLKKLEIMKTFIITILTIFFAINIYSQNINNQSDIIVYDYDPDVRIINEGADTLKIDFNKDGVLDLMFYLVVTSGGEYPTIKSLNNNCMLTLITETDTLNSKSLLWYSDFTYLMGCHKSEKIGIKLNINNQNYSGWIHSLFSKENREALITIDKYAFCTIPDYPLLWGQTELTGTKEIKVQDKIKVSVDGHSQIINIQSKEVVKEISLINSSGRVIRKWRNIKSSKFDISSEGIKGGVYVLRIKTENDEVVTKKIML